jgi:GT2 family glycosyltransferase
VSTGITPDADAPGISVILATDRLDTIREALSHLRGQTAVGRLELVVVAPPTVALDEPGLSLENFHSVQAVEGDPRDSLAAARTAGVMASSAPLIAFAETHCFPEPRWAEVLIETHHGPWAAVGPEMDSENPESAVGWAVLLLGYAPWIAPAHAGPRDHLPGRNTCYKRSALREYEDELAVFLDSESVLHWKLRARGHQLYLQPAARVRHRSITSLRVAVRETFLSGRVFAAIRARRWRLPRRAGYALGSPLLPLLRGARILAHCRRRGRTAIAVRALPALMVLLACSAAGELVGYLAGDSDSMRRQLAAYELPPDR